MGQMFIVLMFYYMITISATISLPVPTAPHLCSPHNAFLLFQFKQSFQIDEDFLQECEPYSSKIMSWKKSIDCCMWDGVTCDVFTGEVIGLDLSCAGLYGEIHSNSTLFQLSHLQTLNLAFNYFNPSLISSKFAEFQSLTHLNLSGSYFTGAIPSEFSGLSNLISLDLSSSSYGTLPSKTFKSLIQNLTQLRELVLDSVNISSTLPHNLSTSLQLLSLKGTNLFGEVPLEIFHLPNLHFLKLSENLNLTINLSKVEWNTSGSLSYLDLSDIGFYGRLPEYIGNLKSLYHLGLSGCYFFGSIPRSIGNLTHLTFLDLSDNHNLTGSVPSTLANLRELIALDLSGTSLGGQLPNFFSNFKNLVTLRLSNNHFNGYFPSSINNLTKLEVIDLSYNSLTGPLFFPLNIGGFSNHLGNSLNSTIPSGCQSIREILLRGNKLHGPIPKSISKLVNLVKLDLSYNHFSGNVEVSLFSNIEQLVYLDLSFNSLSLVNNQVIKSTMPHSLQTLLLSSCAVKDLDFLIGTNNIAILDLSHNKLHGKIFMHEKWNTWGQSLWYLYLSYNYLTYIHQLPSNYLIIVDLRYNLFSGPLCVPSIQSMYYFASYNNFSGEIPSLICNLTRLQVLDLSSNNLSGAIPQCLGNMTELSVLDLHMNNLHGTIPSSFSVGSQLTSLNLHNNLLEGSVPRSLSNCKELQVVEIGYNNLNGTFPWWLQRLAKLQVLNLRDNHLCGPLTIYGSGPSFPALRILDLSQNEFTSTLPQRFFLQLEAMTKIVNRIIDRQIFGDTSEYYKTSVVITEKGLDRDVASVFSILTTIDLSSNKFEGTIPNVIGDLISLQVLNLSHNKFGGQIPLTLQNLNGLESFDLSSNQLEGEIPPQLTALTFLSVLNLSQNHLEGSIPHGHQFDTFGNDSYLGNDGLCGAPLSKICEANINELRLPTSVTTASNFMNGFTWEAVMIGYLSGMVIGLSIGCLSFMSGKPKWFNRMVEEEGKKLSKKKA